MPSVGRSINDSMVPLAKLAAGRYSPEFLHAIDRALAVRPEDRPQSVAEFRALLSGSTELVSAAPVKSEPKVAAVVPPPPARVNRMPLIAGGVAVLLVVAAGGLYLLQPKPEPTTPAVAKGEPGAVSTPAAKAAPEAGAAPATAGQAPAATVSQAPGEVQTTDQKGVTEQQLVDMLLGKNGATDSAKRGAKAFDPVDALQAIYQQRDSSALVTVVPEKAKVRIGKDKLRFRLTSLKPGYVYVLMVGTDGKFNLLFPNALDADNGIAGDGELSLPRPGWAMTAGGPAGIDHFLAIISENRRDFASAGLTKVDPFAEFPRKTAEKIAREAPAGAASPFAGKVVCPAGRSCSPSYGAALFAIEEIN